MQKCYIAGKVTGLEQKIYYANFRRAEIAVAILGFEAVNPITLPHQHDCTWTSYMREALTAMLECNQLYVLPDWEDSRGATIEVKLARELGIPIIYQDKLVFKND